MIKKRFIMTKKGKGREEERSNGGQSILKSGGGERL
jgi:hypothetical protein